jgi:molybdenum cofactor cytidylyltransferase
MSAMAKALAGQVKAVAPEFDGQRGHPVLLSAALFPKLLTLNGDQGAGVVLKDLGDGLTLVPAPDDGCLFDIDRPDDLDGFSIRP